VKILNNEKCSHGEVEFLGIERGSSGVNKYYRCKKCGAVLVLSEEGVLYEIPGIKSKSEAKSS